MRIWLTSALLAVLWAMQPVAYAQDGSAPVRPGFAHAGVITQVDPGTHSIVVNNTHVYLSLGVTVHGVGKSGSFAMLRPGQFVAWGPTGRKQESGTVTEIWIRPPS
ncbi:MAG: hypothetical protein P8076_14275 [Gammaproteobacteria bacterium]